MFGTTEQKINTADHTIIYVQKNVHLVIPEITINKKKNFLSFLIFWFFIRPIFMKQNLAQISKSSLSARVNLIEVFQQCGRIKNHAHDCDININMEGLKIQNLLNNQVQHLITLKFCVDPGPNQTIIITNSFQQLRQNKA